MSQADNQNKPVKNVKCVSCRADYDLMQSNECPNCGVGYGNIDTGDSIHPDVWGKKLTVGNSIFNKRVGEI
jgi:hypothetical protein